MPTFQFINNINLSIVQFDPPMHQTGHMLCSILTEETGDIHE